MATLNLTIDKDRGEVFKLVDDTVREYQRDVRERLGPISENGQHDVQVKLGHVSENGQHIEITGERVALEKLQSAFKQKGEIASIRE
ncbi:MAG: hypothetical protein NTZ49_01540 [Candidatus Parcubacteria bacterium]|nr:hypothetical protein [Candidatus Parcubacteria bacterium]